MAEQTQDSQKKSHVRLEIDEWSSQSTTNGRVLSPNMPERYLSQPMCNQDSPFSSLKCSSKNDNVGVVHQSMSEGQLSSCCNTPPSTPISRYHTSTPSQDHANEDRVTRSGIFICDTPGSIAAGICGPDVSSKEKLLATLSNNRDPVIKTYKENKLAPPGVIRRNAPLPVSSDDLHSKKLPHHFVMGGSKSAAMDLKTHCISKLVTNKAIASSGQSIGSVNKEVTIDTDNGQIRDTQVKCEFPMAAKLRGRSPLTRKRLRSPPVHFVTSYVKSILPTLPCEKVVPSSPNSNLQGDGRELREWVEKWGSGMAGRSKAHTLQKLRNAQRKGERELQWQLKLEQLERNELFAPKVKRIHQLQEQIKNARQRDKIIDEQIEQDKAVRPSSDLSRQIEQLETRNKSLRERNELLLDKVLSHPLLSILRDTIQHLGGKGGLLGEHKGTAH